MKFSTTRPIKLQTPFGPRLYQPGEVFQADPEKARIYVERGLLTLIEENPFETLQANLCPKLAGCAWCNLTPDEKIRWETAIKIQGQAEKTGDISKWKEMADILLEIAKEVKVV